jgi:phage-related tail fiber protein
MDYPKSVPGVGLVDGKFADENQVTGTPGSLIPSSWGNAVTEELLAVIQAAGLVPAEENNGQLLQAIRLIGAPGQVATFARSTPPTGWLKANGALVSRTTYAALFAAIGTTFGVGDGATTFALPDLRGEFLRGWDDGRGIDTGRDLGSSQLDALQNITARVTLNRTNVSAVSGGGAFSSEGVGLNQSPAAGSSISRDLLFDASRVARTAAETRPRNIALLACIKY